LSYENRAKEMGILIDTPPSPAENYLTVVMIGSLVYTSGNGPIKDGQIIYVGRLGESLTVEEGYEAAKLATVNLILVLRNYLGSLDRINRIVKVTGFVNSTPGFTAQPKVINGASDLLVEVFGEQGRHARCAIGVAALPRGMAVEIDLIAEVKK